MLEHHADFATDFVDLADVVGELDSIDDNLTALMLFQAIDATDHRRLAGAGWAADNDALAGIDAQVDVLQDMELAVPFVHANHLHRDLCGVGLRHSPCGCL